MGQLAIVRPISFSLNDESIRFIRASAECVRAARLPRLAGRRVLGYGGRAREPACESSASCSVTSQNSADVVTKRSQRMRELAKHVVGQHVQVAHRDLGAAFRRDRSAIAAENCSLTGGRIRTIVTAMRQRLCLHSSTEGRWFRTVANAANNQVRDGVRRGMCGDSGEPGDGRMTCLLP